MSSVERDSQYAEIRIATDALTMATEALRQAEENYERAFSALANAQLAASPQPDEEITKSSF
jgi:mannose/cellobiose epimerase-like protein (N-acyl-D-glucosamine 2-epimerase family)